MSTSETNDVVYGILQIAGPNRPGMIAETSSYVLNHGGNIVTSHGTRFSKQIFAANILVSAPPADFAKIEAGLSALQSLQPRLLPTRGPSPEEKESTLLYELTLYAYDAEGILSKVSELLTADHLDVVQLSAVTYPAPFEGQALFMIELIVEAPNPTAGKRAHENVEALAQFHSWDVYWKPILRTGVKISPVAAYPPSKLSFKIERSDDEEPSPKPGSNKP